MAALHEALTTLGPVDFSEVPTTPEDQRAYLEQHLAAAHLLVHSVPPPPPPANAASSGRGRSSTVGASPSAPILPATCASMVLPSAVRHDATATDSALQAEWGRPVKLAPKDNPLGFTVHKLAARDGRGAWFARRSVHEGLSFRRWKEALQHEFPASLAVQGAPGEGNIRGIGADEHLERIEVEGVGAIEVYRFSAQFPGPTTPRDFVELLLTSSNAPPASDPSSVKSPLGSGTSTPASPALLPTGAPAGPRTYLIISKPCAHPSAAPTSGMIRGAYESIEFIRELPRRGNKRNSVAAGGVDLKALAAEHKAQLSLARDVLLRRTGQRSNNDSTTSLLDEATAPAPTEEGGKAQQGGPASSSRRSSVQLTDELDRNDPVEWIQITRSDPGGSVPRFMVERGTPASIAADAAKFLDWACARDPSGDGTAALSPTGPNAPHRSSLSLPTGLVASPTGAADLAASDPGPLPDAEVRSLPDRTDAGKDPSSSFFSSLTSSVASAAYAGFETYAPRIVSPFTQSFAHHPNPSTSTSSPPRRGRTLSSSSSSSSNLSYASAQPGDARSLSPGVSAAAARAPSPHAAALEAAHAAKLAQLHADLAEAQQKAGDDAKKLAKIATAHERATAKATAAHAKSMAGRDAEKRKAERKQLEREERTVRRAREAEMKDERMKLREEIKGLKEEVKRLKVEAERAGKLEAELERVKAEKAELEGVCRGVQGENTRLVARVGGKEVLEEVRREGKEAEEREKEKEGNGKKNGENGKKGKDKDAKEKDEKDRPLSVRSGKSGVSGISAGSANKATKK